MLTLKKLEYAEYRGTDREWSLEEFELSNINLLVGKNAVGKTRTLNIINGLANLLSGRKGVVYRSGHFNAHFVDNDETIDFELIISDKRIEREILKFNGETFLDRGKGGKGKIHAVQLETDIEFQAPENELASVSRRDTIQHPYFEKLYNWGAASLFYKFSTDLGRTRVSVTAPNLDKEPPIDTKETERVVAFLKGGLKAHGDKFEKTIKKKMKLIGYEIEDLMIIPLNEYFDAQIGPGIVEGIGVKEKGVKDIIPQILLSQGMFRVLSLIIQLEYCQQSSHPSMILIDDIGEGLDFERSVSLIKLLVDEKNLSPVQLIMATNDRFIMNNVPLEFWSIIQRTGSKCKIFNHKNSKEKFDEFKFTGLSNFDFLAYDFINQVEETK